MVTNFNFNFFFGLFLYSVLVLLQPPSFFAMYAKQFIRSRNFSKLLCLLSTLPLCELNGGEDAASVLTLLKCQKHVFALFPHQFTSLGGFPRKYLRWGLSFMSQLFATW